MIYNWEYRFTRLFIRIIKKNTKYAHYVIHGKKKKIVLVNINEKTSFSWRKYFSKNAEPTGCIKVHRAQSYVYVCFCRAICVSLLCDCLCYCVLLCLLGLIGLGLGQMIDLVL
jgi:hypothetical protein